MDGEWRRKRKKQLVAGSGERAAGKGGREGGRRWRGLSEAGTVPLVGGGDVEGGREGDPT